MKMQSNCALMEVSARSWQKRQVVGRKGRKGGQNRHRRMPWYQVGRCEIGFASFPLPSPPSLASSLPRSPCSVSWIASDCCYSPFSAHLGLLSNQHFSAFHPLFHFAPSAATPFKGNQIFLTYEMFTKRRWSLETGREWDLLFSGLGCVVE